MVGLFNKAQLCIFGNLTKENCIAIYLFCKEVRRLYRSSGAIYTGQYLKVVAIKLMTFVGGKPEYRHAPPTKVRVSLTRAGIPRIIPPFHRRAIRMRRDDRLVKLYLSLCSLSKLIMQWPEGRKVSPATIHVKNYSPGPRCIDIANTLAVSARLMLGSMEPKTMAVPLRLGFRWKPTWSSGPNT